MDVSDINDRRYLKAKEKVDAIKGFYIHLISFILVNCGLIAINLSTSIEDIWFIWPLFGWGIGLTFHGLGVFGNSLLGKDWEVKKMKQFMEEEQRNQEKWKS